MTELSAQQISLLQARLPQFQHCYETLCHTKIDPPASHGPYIEIAIPSGQKEFAWITFCSWHPLGANTAVVFILQINKQREITGGRYYAMLSEPRPKLALGTFVYGVMVNDVFIIEDMFEFCGIHLHSQKTLFAQKLGYLEQFFNKIRNCGGSTPVQFTLPNMWIAGGPSIASDYNIHHIQFRCLCRLAPVVTMLYSTFRRLASVDEICSLLLPSEADTTYMFSSPLPTAPFLPQYKRPTAFHVVADVQFDIYHILADDNVYVGIAGIPSIRVSQMMNRLFRRLPETMDACEESDCDDVFENIREDKYLLCTQPQTTSRLMMCSFFLQQNRWVPMLPAPASCTSAVAHTQLIPNKFTK